VWTEIPDTVIAHEGEIIEFNIAGEDVDGDALGISFHSDNLPDSARFEDYGDGTGDFAWAIALEDAGEYSAIFTLTDGELSVQTEVAFLVLGVNRPPVLANLEDHSLEEGEGLRFQVSAEDPDGDEISFFADNLPPGAEFTDMSFQWMPDFDQAGQYAVTFIVTDDGDPELSDEQTISITIENINRPPVLAGIGNQGISEDEEIVIDLQAEDPDGDEVTFSSDNMPAGSVLRAAHFPGFLITTRLENIRSRLWRPMRVIQT